MDLPEPLGPEDDGVLALRDGKRDAIEHDAVAALHGDVLEIDERDIGHGTHIVAAAPRMSCDYVALGPPCSTSGGQPSAMSLKF